jgi:hypothetical protein
MTSKLNRCHLLLAFAAVCSLSIASQAEATIVGAQSFGNELAGGRILVTFAQTGVQAAPIVVGGPGEGTANVPNAFTFSVTGDTFLADWTLRNDTTFDTILLVEFDLTGTMSQPDPNGPVFSPGVLFDDNTLPSTPNSFAGRQGAVQVNVGAPLIINSFEHVPWVDAMNLGDEWVHETIEYLGFGPLLTSVWRDDTDIVGVDTGPEVPEPTSLVLFGAGAGISCLFARRR